MTQTYHHLPSLRQDLRILSAARLFSGAPGWVIFDPMAHRYYQIGQSVLELLSHWHAGTIAALQKRIADHYGRHVELEEIARLRQFLGTYELLENMDATTLVKRQRSRIQSWLMMLVHNYLFFKIPLVRPQRFLDRTRYVGDILFSKYLLVVVALLGIFGMVLAMRQWDTFLATGIGLLGWEGALIVAACVPVVKTAHELGHAYMAARYGVRVPTMGIAFMVMAPFLYSDVTDAWRLTSRGQRLAIDCAGLIVEVMIACVALFLWVFLLPGPLRSAVFALATTSFVMGLILNLNPFMRFDGYHILSDLVGIPNLQTRAMAVGRWALREILFDVKAHPPEQMSGMALFALAVYAYAIWIYRFLLFLGIAILVYHYAFKALGVILFAIEIIWFIALPIVNEMRRWWRGRALVAMTRRAMISFGLLAVSLLLFVLPLPNSVSIPAVASARLDAMLFSRMPARIVEIHIVEGQAVKAGDVLLQLESPMLQAQIRLAESELALKRIKLAQASTNSVGRSDLRILDSEVQSVSQKIDTLHRENADLTLKAPHDGEIRDFDPDLHAGVWVGGRKLLARVVSGKHIEFRGYVAEADLHRLRLGAKGKFHPDDASRPSISVALEEIGAVATDSLDLPILASIHDGAVEVVHDRNDAGLKPLMSIYPVRLSSTEKIELNQEVRGHIQVEGAWESLALRVARRVIAVLIRESGA